MSEEALAQTLTSVVKIDTRKPSIKTIRTHIKSSATRLQNKNIPLLQDEKYEHLTIAMVGGVDCGKTTLVGVITNKLLWDNPKENLKQCLDDGDGEARSRVMQYPHEIESGRTSSISYTPLLLKKDSWSDLKQSRLISFCDLCGHEKYLRNTVSGICSAFPDFALICIDRKINPMTKEHIKILTAMNVPYAVLLTKIDNMPKETLTENIKETTRKLKKIIHGKKIFLIKSDNECNFPFNYDAQVPVILISNTTGSNILRLMQFLSIIPQRIIDFPPFFQIDGIYNVYGHGVVVSGNSGIKISTGDKLLIGPFSRRRWKGTSRKIYDENNSIKFEVEKCFVEVNVRSIHDNYRNSISELPANSRGCLCIRFSAKDIHFRHEISKGQILCGASQLSQNSVIKITNRILAEIKIFQGHHTTIKNGFNAFCNIGTIRTPAIFNLKEDCARSGDKIIAELLFSKPICPTVGTQFIFREGLSIGYGIIKEIL